MLPYIVERIARDVAVANLTQIVKIWFPYFRRLFGIETDVEPAKVT
jgi:hypothetical protein